MTTATNPFLDSIPFLTPEDRAALAAHRYDNLDALLGTTQASLVADVKLPSGLAAQLVRWANSRDPGTAVDEAGVLLNLLGGPRHGVAARALRDLGVVRCCVGADGRVSADQADYAADGYPAVSHYKESRVVPVEEVGGPRLHHPRSGEVLTRGDAVQWITLGRDALVIAAAIFDQDDILAGEGQRAVFTDVKAGDQMSRAAKARLATDRALRARCEALIDGTGMHEPLTAADAVAKLHKAPTPRQPRAYEETRRLVLEAAEPVLTGDLPNVRLELLHSVRPNQVSSKSTVYVAWDFALEPELAVDVIRAANELGLDAKELQYRGSGSAVVISKPDVRNRGRGVQ